MKILIKPAFKRDVNKVTDTILLNALVKKIEQIKNAEATENITGIKALSGYSTFYRIYVKTTRYSYRIGAVVRKDTIWLVRFLPRKKIYRQFP